MSVAVAIVLAADEYAIAADGRLTTHAGGPAQHTEKLFRYGPWLGAWVGEMATAQAFLRALPPWAADGADLEASLLVARRAVVPDFGLRSGEDQLRYLDIDLLFVGPAGLVILRGHGTLLRPGRPYAVIGCADEYVSGRLDVIAETRELVVEDALLAVAASAEVYPGVGPPFTTLRHPG